MMRCPFARPVRVDNALAFGLLATAIATRFAND